MGAVTSRDPAVALSGEWEFKTDPDGVGEENAWYTRSDWEGGRVVSVPHSWQEHDDLREYTGIAWYRTTFDFDGTDGRAILAFGAVDYETTVWVNGQRVGTNTGGYLPFSVDVTDAVQPGENTVVLRVYDPEDISEIPHGKQGEPWYTRVSGPWQRVDLVTVPTSHVRTAQVTPDLRDDTAGFEVTVAGERDDRAVEITVRRDTAVVANARASVTDGVATATLEIEDADYWTPEDPVLYDFEVALVDGDTTVDTYQDYFGMRSFAAEDGQLYLNGDPFFMRGALDQAFYPETFYRPQDQETFEHEVRTAKELGFNLLRKHIKPAHPAFVEAADRLGILVWEEPANPSRYTPASKRRVREQLHGMIRRDFNRPSVVVWSVYNEEWGIGGAGSETSLWEDTEKQDFLEQLYEETKALDPTRLVCDNSGWAHVATDLNDYHEYFVAPDRIDPWRERLDEVVEHPAGNYGDTRTDPDVAPVVVSEFGTWGLPDVSKFETGDENPHWFRHDFLDGMKRPDGVRRNFDESAASTVFESIEKFAVAWQRREFESVEPMIADMRERDEVAGYCITELSDIEWEFNGVVDYLREEKVFHDDLARVNAPVLFYVAVDSHVVWSGETVRVDLVVVNDTNDYLEATVDWEGMGTTGTVDIEVGPSGSRRFEDLVAVRAPGTDGIETRDVTVHVDDHDETVSREVVVVDGDTVSPRSTVYAEESGLRERLRARGYSTVANPSDGDVAIVSDPDTVDVDRVLVVPDETGDLVETSEFEYTALPRQKSWSLCACFIYQDLLADVGPVPGWVFEGIYPYGYVSETEPTDSIAVGYTEGWVANSGAVVMDRTNGGRELGFCALRVTDSYGDHPIATVVVDRMVQALTETTDRRSSSGERI